MIKGSQRRMDKRRKSAAERKEAREERSAAEQVAVLDSILGEGEGAVKERARLAKAS